ncbi:aldo/keto reductase [Terribacillus saccharophilus]|uniref:aldo/keto reductase n=1 Tax=Terribacillus saccharophilus TaxID=361277 RepID=UPI003D280141
MKSVKLNNGNSMPILGYGVFRVEDGKDLADKVYFAIEQGYRSIDTAAIYGNEASVGQGINRAMQAGLVKREELFVTSKVWNAGLTFEQTKAAYQESLEKMQLEYLDLYLIHWPGKDKFLEAYRALEELYQEKKVKAIGVSNFQVHHLEKLLSAASVVPAVNQVEFHPRLIQEQLRAYTKEKGILLEAWSPLMNGELLAQPLLQELSAKYGKSPAQIVLRWDIQHDVITIPKSMTDKRIIENKEVFDFEIQPEDMERLDQLDDGTRSGPHPDEFDF